MLDEENNAVWKLRKFAFVFPYDYHEGSTASRIASARSFDVACEDSSVTITAEHVGLKDVEKVLGLDPVSASN
jgi:hypothetical protein